MSDLISRQMVIDELGALSDAIFKNIEKGATYPKKQWFDGMANAESIIKNLPSAQSEPHWIPVSERLPEANGRYLVTRGLNACGAMWNRVYIINYSDLMGLKSERIWWDGNVGKSDFERIDNVIAWMPLVKPYKEEQ